MTTHNNHKALGFSLGLMSVILAGAIASQFKLWQQQQQLETLEQQNIKQEQTRFAQMTAEIKQINQSLQSISKPRTQIEDLQWLIQEADWQLNLFHRLDLSQHLLKLALKLAQTENWQGLSQALAADLKQLSLIELSSSHEIIEVCAQLQTQLKPLIATTPIQLNQTEDAQLPKYVQVFKPYFQIERYANVSPKILPPNRQNQIIAELNLLLPGIQTAALTHQQALYDELLQQFQQSWESLKATQNVPKIDKLLAQLQNYKISLTRPIRFQATDSAQNLEHQLFSQARI